VALLNKVRDLKEEDHEAYMALQKEAMMGDPKARAKMKI
jgi:hypothetical protein